MSLSSLATSLFIYFSSVLAYAQSWGLGAKPSAAGGKGWAIFQ